MNTRRYLRLALLGIGTILAAAAVDAPPLVDAAKQGDLAALRALIESGADVNAAEGDGATALHWASHRDDLEAADLLILAGADVNAVNYLGVTPLWSASLNGSPAMARKLLAAGARPNATLPSGETLVMTAARTGNADVVEQLLAAGADPNGSAERGQTALMWAASQQHAGVVEVLLRYGADVHARSDVWTQLWQSTQSIEVHPDLHMWIQHGGLTPLLFAARVGDLASAKLLLAAGADVNDATAYGTSATVVAVQSGNLELVELLLESGADPNAAGAGYAALHWAILRRDTDVVAALLANGADPSMPLLTDTPFRRLSPLDLSFHPAWIGATPFWLAARFNEPDVMRLLVDHGADPSFVHYVDYWGDGEPVQGWPRVTEGETTALMAAAGMGAGSGFRRIQDPAEAEALAIASIELALELGIDPNAANAQGRTALDSRYGETIRGLMDR
jgi:ankyrin